MTVALKWFGIVLGSHFNFVVIVFAYGLLFTIVGMNMMTNEQDPRQVESEEKCRGVKNNGIVGEDGSEICKSEHFFSALIIVQRIKVKKVFE